jgi:hypothetical protein
MTRVYARGSKSLLRSADVRQDDIDSIVDQYIQCVKKVKNSYNIEVSRDLEPLNDNHQNLEIKSLEGEVRIGYQTQDCWITISRYDISEKKWVQNNINEKSCIFDNSLLVLNIEHTNKYENHYDFARNEFYQNDGETWIQWFKDTEDREWLDPIRGDFE